MSTQRHVIPVLGCHRSGTSAVTRGLRALNGVIGDDLLPPVEGNNPTGFWEDRALHVALQDAQRRAGSDWDELSYGWADEHREVLLAAKPRIKELFDERASVDYPFVFKNPRASLMLPELRNVLQSLDVAASYVIVVRDPLSTAQSLKQRDGLPLELGGLLWARYLGAAVQGTAGCDRVFVGYDAYLADPEAELRRIEAALEVPQLMLIRSELEQLTDEFLQPALRHHVNTQEDLERHPAITEDTVEAYVRAMAATESAPEQAGQVDDDFWADLVSSQEARTAEYRLIDETRRTTKAQAGELSELREAPVRLQSEVDRLARALDANSDALESVRATVDERVAAAEREAEARLREAQATAVAENHELTQQVEQMTGQLSELQDVAGRLLVERDAARANAAQSIEQIDSVMSSTSWLLTKPVRMFGDLAKARVRRQ